MNDARDTRTIRPAPRAVLFDLDGTLVDTAPDLGLAANLVREGLGLTPLPLSVYRPVASEGARGLLRAGLQMTPEHPAYPQLREQLLRHYRANLAAHSRLFEGLGALLERLAARDVRWGVMTNKPSWLTEPLMRELALFERAACVISADQVPRAKPAPDGLLLALQRLDLPASDCIYVGDDARDVTAARAAGIRSVAASWGYLGDSIAIESWNADYLAASPAALAAMLE